MTTWLVRIGSKHTGVYRYVGKNGEKAWRRSDAFPFDSFDEACAEADLWTNGHVILHEGIMGTKEYERAAQIIQAYTRIDALREHLVQCFVDFFKEDNPRFDSARFRHACIPGANVKARTRKAANVTNRD